MNDQHFHALAQQRRHQQYQAEAKAVAQAKRLKRIRAETANGPKIIHLDGVIGSEPGELSARWLRAQLPTDGRGFVLKIHSEGGSVFEAFTMFDMLAQHPGPKRCEVASMAFSAASLLPCCFDDSAITPSGYMMIHAPRFEGEEVSDTDTRLLENLKSRMIGMYCERTGKPESDIRRLVENEAYFDAEASVDFGLIHAVASSAVVAKRIPNRIVARIKSPESARAKWQQAVTACGSVRKANEQNPGLRLKMLAEVNQ